MTSINETVIAAHPLGVTPGITPVHPRVQPQIHQCEMPLNIGVFFDGTGNNQDWVEPGLSQTQRERKKDSNVARLFRAYRDEDWNGYFRIYIPGVGTPFPKIGEETPASLGEAFGAGGDGRINFGLLQVINAMYWSVSPNKRLYVPDDTVKALCRNGRRTATIGRHGDPQRSSLESHEDEPALRRVNMDANGGLLLDLEAQAPQRQAFFKRACRDIQAKMAEVSKPKITEIFVDVYGFSRGAAEARTFTNWLLELFDGEMLCGVPAKLRFLGLFDTVASVGLPASVGMGQNGHRAWAQPEWLRIPKQVQNCVHFVAMHENRGSFPVELIQQDGHIPENCQEFMFPGMHSDVGGGYSPQEQGRGPTGENAEKLSQMALNAMYLASRKALVPIDRKIARGNDNEDPFETADATVDAFNAFMSARQKPRPIREWMFEYLAWRYQVRNSYLSLPWHKRASASDRDDLSGANALLLKDVDALNLHLHPVSTSTWNRQGFQAMEQNSAEARVACLRDEAPNIFKRLLSTPAVDHAAAALFADYCHDSYAGFRPFDQVTILGLDLIPGSWEPEGYFRWRRRYEGNNTQLVRRDPIKQLDHMPQTEIAAGQDAASDRTETNAA